MRCRAPSLVHRGRACLSRSGHIIGGGLCGRARPLTGRRRGARRRALSIQYRTDGPRPLWKSPYLRTSVPGCSPAAVRFALHILARGTDCDRARLCSYSRPAPMMYRKKGGGSGALHSRGTGHNTVAQWADQQCRSRSSIHTCHGVAQRSLRRSARSITGPAARCKSAAIQRACGPVWVHRAGGGRRGGQGPRVPGPAPEALDRNARAPVTVGDRRCASGVQTRSGPNDMLPRARRHWQVRARAQVRGQVLEGGASERDGRWAPRAESLDVFQESVCRYTFQVRHTDRYTG